MFGRAVFLFTIVCQMYSCVEVPNLVMNNGRQIPAIALGTYLGFGEEHNSARTAVEAVEIDMAVVPSDPDGLSHTRDLLLGGVLKSKDNEFRDVVLQAIDIGYRHFDTAAIYSTEGEIGDALRMRIDQGKFKREDFFITTKLWNTHHERGRVPLALKESLDRLGLNYVDLYLMHWPVGLNENYTFSDVDFMETWRGMEDVLKLGLTKAIGVSNFNLEQLKRILDEGHVKPDAIQIELHPLNIQKELVEYAQAQGLVVMGYSPFGSLVARFGQWSSGPRVNDTTLVAMAQKYGKTVPQVVLRWAVDRNVIPLPKTVNPKRLQENINIFDFKLEEQEVDKINQFDSGTRFTLPSFWQNHPYYPFEKVDNPIPDPFVSTNSSH